MCIAAYVNFSGVKYCLIKQVAVDSKDHCVFTTATLCFLILCLVDNVNLFITRLNSVNSQQALLNDCLHYFPLRVILHFANSRENRYKLWVQSLGAFGWTSVGYDWSIVFKATINQSYVTLVHQNDPRTRCAESFLYPFAFQFLEWGIRKNCISRIIQEITLKIQSATALYGLAREARKKLQRVSSIIPFF